MTESLKRIWPRPIGLLLAAVFLAAGLAGCLEVYVDPGPSPARVAVQLKAGVTKAQINEALHRHGEFGMPLVAGQFRTIHGPYWKWQLLYILDENNLRDLRTSSPRPSSWIKGHSLTGEAEFLVPPGRHRVRLLTQVFMEITFRETWFEETSEPVEVASYSEDFSLDLKPGEVFSIKRVYAPPKNP